MAIKATRLRQNLYRILDEVLETGVPVEVERGDRLVRLVPVAAEGRRLDRLVRRHDIVGDPEELVHVDWSSEWGGADEP